MKNGWIRIGVSLIIILLLSILLGVLSKLLLSIHFIVFVAVIFLVGVSMYFVFDRKIAQIAQIIDSSNRRIFDFLDFSYDVHYTSSSKFIPFHYLLKAFNLFNDTIDTGLEKLASVQKDLKHLQKLNHAKTHTLETLLTISQETLQSDHQTAFYERILSAAIDVIEPAEKGSILIWDENAHCFKYEACVGYIYDILKEVTFSLEETLLFIKSKGDVSESSIISDVNTLDKAILKEDKYQLLHDSEGLNIADTLTSPIYIDHKLYAILNLDSTNANAFANVDIQLIDFFTSQISIALQNNLLLEETMRLSHYDRLTGVYNRNYFEKLFDQFNHNAMKTLKPYAFVLCDLNGLKTINDSYGHQAGDKVLVTFTSLIKKELKKDDIFARIGGDEFVIILRDTTPEAATDKLASLFEKYKDYTIEYNVYHLPVSFSYGLSFFPNDSMVFEVLSKIADMRMYEFKSQYKAKHPNLMLNQHPNQS